jgi:hypothetical protein
MTYPTTTGAFTGPSATTGDFNADGKVDLAITNQSNNTVSILLGNGDGTFQGPLESTTGNFAAGVAAGDFNGDGRLDLAVADLQANTVSVMLQRPEPATNLAVSGATASQVSLTWTASTSSDVVSYNVYRSTTSGAYTSTPLASVGASTTPGFTDSTVSSGTTYFYVVTAVIASKVESVFSNEVSATTPPAPPTNVMAAPPAAPGDGVFVSWTASSTKSGVLGYNVYRGTTQGGPYDVKVNTAGLVNALSFTDKSVSSGTTYYYVVTAVIAGNVESIYSNEASVQVP